MKPRIDFRRALVLVGILSLQAMALFSCLDRLPVWTDELFTYGIMRQPLPVMIKTLQADIHPPLYYLLLRLWPWHDLSGLRAFSAVWALAAVLLLDRLWVRRWKNGYRILALCLLAFSPCLLLYGRMARSYAMQMCLALAAVAFLWSWIRTRKRSVPAFLACLLLLYTHYLPGIAVLAAFTIAGRRRLPVRQLVIFLAAIFCGYLPWLPTLAFAMARWGGPPDFFSRYTITGSPLAEQVVKAGYGAVSLSIGESFPFLSLLLVPVILAVAWYGAWLSARFAGSLTAMAVIAAIIGFLGVSRWVAYPFIPARLLWLLPFLTLATAFGLRKMAWKGRWVAALILLSFAASARDYLRKENYLNKGYAAPVREIAAELNRRATAKDLIIVDAFNTDGYALKFYVSAPAPLLFIVESDERSILDRAAKAESVWIVRNERDISPGRLTSRVEETACASRRREKAGYLPYSAWQRATAQFITGKPLTYFYQVVHCQ